MAPTITTTNNNDHDDDHDDDNNNSDDSHADVGVSWGPREEPIKPLAQGSFDAQGRNAVCRLKSKATQKGQRSNQGDTRQAAGTSRKGHPWTPLEPRRRQLERRQQVEAKQASYDDLYSIATDLLGLDQITIRKKSPSDDEMRATAACGVFYRCL